MKAAHTLFDRLRSRVKFGITTEALAWIAVAITVFVFGSYLVDRNLRLEVGYRIVLLAILVVAVFLILLRRWLRPLALELTDDELALAVERQDPGIRQSLISAVQFERTIKDSGEREESHQMMSKVVGDVEARIRDLPFHRAVRRGRSAGFASVLLCCGVLVGSWAVLSGDATLWAARNLGLSDQPWPRDTLLAFLDTEPGTALRIAERDDLTVRVRAQGVIPDSVILRATFESGESIDRSMEQVGEDTFTCTLNNVLESLELQAEGGDGITGTMSIVLVPRPVLSGLQVVIRPPEYMQLEPEQIDAITSDIRVPVGATLEISARSDKNLETAQVVFGDSVRIDAVLDEGSRSFRASFQPESNGVLSVEAVDTDRLGPSQPPQAYIQLAEDTAPRLDYRSNGVGSLITDNARLPGRLECRDDYGLRSIEASFQISEAVAVTQDADVEAAPFEPAPITGMEQFVAGETLFTASTEFDLEKFDSPTSDPDLRRFKPGQLLALRFNARDYQPESEKEAIETVHFRIVTREKLLEELQRRQSEQRSELERVLKRETALRDELLTLDLSRGGTDTESVAARGLSISRSQQSLGRRVQTIAGRYQQILDEFENNRLFEAAVTRTKSIKIVDPLLGLAEGSFPRSSSGTATWAETRDSSVKPSLVEVYNEIIAVITRVLSEMEHTEDIAAVLEALRNVIKTENEAENLVEELRNRAMNELFGPGNETGSSKEKDK